MGKENAHEDYDQAFGTLQLLRAHRSRNSRAALRSQCGSYDRRDVVEPGLPSRGGRLLSRAGRRLSEGERQQNRLQPDPERTAAPEGDLGDTERRRPRRDGAKGGRIIAFSSSVIAKSFPGYGAYIASKAGVEGLVPVLANELRGRQITVNAVAPGPVATELFLKGKTEAQIEGLKKMVP